MRQSGIDEIYTTEFTSEEERSLRAPIRMVKLLQRAEALHAYCADALHPYRRRYDNFQRKTDMAAAEYSRLSNDIVSALEDDNLWPVDRGFDCNDQKIWFGRPKGCKRPAREIIRKLISGSRRGFEREDLHRGIEQHQYLQLIGMAGRKKWAFWVNAFVLEAVRAYQADTRRIIELARKV